MHRIEDLFTKDKCEEALIAGHVAASVFILNIPRVDCVAKYRTGVNGNISIGKALMRN